MGLVESLRAPDNDVEAQCYILKTIHDLREAMRVAAIVLGIGVELIISEPFRKGFGSKDALYITSILLAGETIYISVCYPFILAYKKKIQALMEQASDTRRDEIEAILYKHELDPMDFR